MSVRQHTVVAKAVEKLFASLPKGGQLEVLNHLIGQLGAQNLGGLSDDSRHLLLNELPSTPFGAVETAPHKLCHFEAYDASQCSEVSFVIPKGVSGKEILHAINKVSMSKTERRVVDPESQLLRDIGLDIVAMSDRSIRLSVCFGLHSQSRSEQRACLAQHGLEFAPRWALTLAAALYRDANGYPSNQRAIGTSRDSGDLFRGVLVRTSTGALGSTQDGLHGGAYYQDGRHSDVVAAAAFRS